MYFGDMFVDVRVERAVLAMVHRHGIDGTDVEVVAAELGRARSSLYRQYGSWRDLLAYTHGRIIDAIDKMFICMRSGRRAQFEEWWADASALLVNPSGAAFRMIRWRLMSDEFEQRELAMLPNLVAWMGTAGLARAVWNVVLGSIDEASSAENRELVWMMVGGEREAMASADQGDEGGDSLAATPSAAAS
jgi:AcrR family transcriptional regulator